MVKSKDSSARLYDLGYVIKPSSYQECVSLLICDICRVILLLYRGVVKRKAITDCEYLVLSLLPDS